MSKGLVSSRSFKMLLAISIAALALSKIAVAAAVGPVTPAQSTATISGTVTDQTDMPIAGASISALSRDVGIERTAITDSEGRYAIALLPSGTYAITAAREGFQPVARQNVPLAVGQNITITFELRVNAIAERITISGSSQLMETTDPAVSALIDNNFVSELPLNGRNLLSLIQLGAGASLFTNKANATINDIGLQISLIGVNKRSNLFLLDGTAINNAIGLAGGAVESLAGIEAVKEVRIHSAAYDAQYGRAAGGVITIVSSSGTNKLKGALYEFHRNDKLDARNFFDGPEGQNFKRNQFGWSLNGPIIKNKTFFFAMAELLRERLGLTKNTLVPDELSRRGLLRGANGLETVGVSENAKPYLDIFPQPNGQRLGDGLAEFFFAFNQKTRANFAQVRIDNSFENGHSFFGRFTFDDSNLVKPLDYPQFSLILPYRNQFLTLEYTRVISENLVSSARLGFARTKLDQFYKDTISPSLRFTEIAEQFGRLSIGGLPVFGGTQPNRILFIRNEFDLSSDLVYTQGQHILKFGGVVTRFQDNEFVPSFRDGQYIFANLRSFLKAQPVAFLSNTPGFSADGALRNTYAGFYIQDDLKWKPGLTLSFGLRYEIATVVKDRYGRQSVLDTLNPLTATKTIPYALLTGTPYKNPSLKNFAPRVGIAWSPFKDTKTSVRAEFGIFYDMLLSLWVTRTALANPPFNTTLTIPQPQFPRQPLITAPGLTNAAVPDFNVQQPHVLKWNLSADREIFWKMTASLAYVGTRGLNLIRSGGVNSPQPSTTLDGRLAFTGRKRNPNFNNIELVRADGDSYYHALQFIVQKRMGGGLQVGSSYTLSRTIDDTQGLSSNEETGQVPQAWIHSNNRLDRGLASFHRKHIYNLSFVYDLPLGHLVARQMRWLLGGWQANGVLAINSGLPFTAGIQTNRSNTGFGLTAVTGMDRPDWAPGRNARNAIIGSAENYFDPSAFALPPQGVIGNVGRNSLIGPNMKTFDLGLKRRIRLRSMGEATALEIRADAFNIFNRANFGLPDRIVFAGVKDEEAPIQSAGRIRSTSTSARQLQIGMKITF